MSGKWVKIGAATVAVAALAGGGVAWATAGDSDESVTGPEAKKAAAAAVAHVGGGQADEVEHAEGGAGWEVEVKRAGGSTVEVNLDEGYHVVGTQQDSEKGDDDSGPGDD
jgi:hypothetical protein